MESKREAENAAGHGSNAGMTEHITTGWDVLNSLVTNLPMIVAAVAGVFAAISGRKSNQQNDQQIAQGLENHKVMKSVELQTNGLTDKLVKAEGVRSRAEGVIEGTAEEHARANPVDERLNEIRGQS